MNDKNPQVINSQAINWLRENLNRLFAKSPLFFKVWQWVWGITFFITGIPEILEMAGVVLPEPFATLANKTIGVAAAVGYIMSLFPTPSTVVAVSDQGDLLKQTDPKKLPFTAKAEERLETKKEDGFLNPISNAPTETVEVSIKSEEKPKEDLKGS